MVGPIANTFPDMFSHLEQTLPSSWFTIDMINTSSLYQFTCITLSCLILSGWDDSGLHDLASEPC